MIRDHLAGMLERYIPAEGYRDYYRWALSADNPRRSLFCRIIALTQLANMTTAVLGDIGGPDSWQVLVRHALPVNVYQIFEVISDNLGLGLSTDPSPVRDLLVGFNAVSAADLRERTGRPATELLASLREPAGAVSAFEQSLAGSWHATVARDYLAVTGRTGGAALEHSIWSGLVANIESGRDVLDALAGTAAEQELRDRTIDRYQAVTRTLCPPPLCRDDLVRTSGQTILVTPTLGYFAAVFGELLGRDRGYDAALADGSLMEMFDTASLLVRLLNDIGTPLLRISAGERETLLRGWRQRHPDSTAIDALALASDEPELNRFRKDILNGEFNICLYGVDQADGWRTFADNLAFFADLHARTEILFGQRLATLDRRLTDHRTTEMTRRFVRFHEGLYTHAYDDAALAGDYAV